ncbi:Membrane protein, distant similarity to thiosulphate:quinone oxidoreductase DoxD [hydrothermal vent metagenome]|uniref:Membrane protein, distant similarity to thiosulphate:quinone oxidoreductase DoxD n=1 Tax=hydrothermal vent metagenome TaxID=652676 RepID=A0A1W1CZ88_9ZZZZ
MRLKDFYLELSVLFNYFQSFSLLFIRLVLAYGFYTPALTKWNNFNTTVEWFSSLGIPFASLATLITASIELMGVVLLVLGLFTRLITMPLMIIMLVASITVHISNGFSVVNNGFEIPLYYFLFLFILVSHGAGKFSLDFLIFGKER